MQRKTLKTAGSLLTFQTLKGPWKTSRKRPKDHNSACSQGWRSPKPLHLKPKHLKMAFFSDRCAPDRPRSMFPQALAISVPHKLNRQQLRPPGRGVKPLPGSKSQKRVSGRVSLTPQKSCCQCLRFLVLEPQTDHAESCEIMADHAKSCP